MSTDPCGSDEPMRKKIKLRPLVHNLKNIKSYLQNRELIDVVLVAGNKRIPAHRIVLGENSKYFDTRFKNSMRTSTQKEIMPEEVDEDALSALIEYCYSGEIEWPEGNMDTLLGTASLLQLDALVEKCCQRLIDQVDSENCLGFTKLANSRRHTKLASAALAHSLKHFTDVVEDREFLCLSSQEVAKLLESEDIIVPSEEIVFHALIKWIQHDPKNRANGVRKLLSYIKLPLLSPTFINEHITRKKLFRGQVTAQNLIIEALSSHLLPKNKATLVQSGPARPRKSTVDVLLAIGEKSIDAFFPGDSTWKEVASIDDKRESFCSAFVQNELVVMGGKIAGKAIASVKSFDFTRRLWRSLPPMKTPRHSFGAAVLDGFLYVVGGVNETGTLRTVETWDPKTQRWNYVASLSKERQDVGVAVFNNKLYAVGDGLSATTIDFEATTFPI